MRFLLTSKLLRDIGVQCNDEMNVNEKSKSMFLNETELLFLLICFTLKFYCPKHLVIFAYIFFTKILQKIKLAWFLF